MKWFNVEKKFLEIIKSKGAREKYNLGIQELHSIRWQRWRLGHMAGRRTE